MHNKRMVAPKYPFYQGLWNSTIWVQFNMQPSIPVRDIHV